MPRTRKGQQKVPILKKTTVLWLSINYYSGVADQHRRRINTEEKGQDDLKKRMNSSYSSIRPSAK